VSESRADSVSQKTGDPPTAIPAAAAAIIQTAANPAAAVTYIQAEIEKKQVGVLLR